MDPLLDTTGVDWHPSSRLPPEVWMHIFDIATFVNNTFVPEIYDYASTYEPVHVPADFTLPLEESLVIRRCLPLVSKAWYRLSIRFLYRSLRVYNISTIRSLAATLQESANQVDHPTRMSTALGSYAQRLDVELPDGQELGPRGIVTDVVSIFQTVSQIIRLTPNLSVVDFSTASGNLIDHVVPSCLVDALCFCGSSLRVVDLSLFLIGMSPTQIRELCGAAPNLRCLFLHTWARNLRAETYEAATIPLMPSLTNFSFSLGTERAGLSMPPENFPSLRHLYCGCNNDWKSKWASLLQDFGHQLTSIHMGGKTFFFSDFATEMQRIVASCPRLERLTLNLPTWRETPAVELPSIRVLGVRPAEAHLSMPWDPVPAYAVLWTSLDALYQRNRSIQSIEFVAHPDSLQGREVANAIGRYPHLPIVNRWIDLFTP